MHGLVQKSLKSQSLRLLFIEQCMNSSCNLKKRVKKKSKQNTDTDVSAQSKRNFSGKVILMLQLQIFVEIYLELAIIFAKIIHEIDCELWEKKSDMSI